MIPPRPASTWKTTTDDGDGHKMPLRDVQLGGAEHYRLRTGRTPPDDGGSAQRAHLMQVYATLYRRSVRKTRRRLRRGHEVDHYSFRMFAPTSHLSTQQRAERDLEYCLDALIQWQGFGVPFTIDDLDTWVAQRWARQRPADPAEPIYPLAAAAEVAAISQWSYQRSLHAHYAIDTYYHHPEPRWLCPTVGVVLDRL